MPTSTRLLRRLLLPIPLAVAVLVAAAPRADAVTIHDLVELTRAGLGDEILVALIEADGTIFSLDAREILRLHEAGVSERVVLAMLRSGRDRREAERAPAAAAPEDPPFTGVVIIGERPSPPPVIVQMPVYVPFVVAWPPRAAPDPGALQPTETFQGFGRFGIDGFSGGSVFPSWGPNFR